MRLQPKISKVYYLCFISRRLEALLVQLPLLRYSMTRFASFAEFPKHQFHVSCFSFESLVFPSSFQLQNICLNSSSACPLGLHCFFVFFEGGSGRCWVERGEGRRKAGQGRAGSRGVWAAHASPVKEKSKTGKI